MIQKEINEIKGTLKYTNCSIQKMAGCYVDTEKNMHIISHEQFLCLPEEDQHKYFAIIKKGLSGKVGRNLINISFLPGETEKRDELLDIVKTELMDEDKVTELFENIKDNYDYPDNYYIMSVFCAYDIPGITSDGIMMEDASSEVYKFVLTLICPMKPSKPGLTYNPVENVLVNADRNILVEPPMHGFLFPSFNGRTTDIHSVLYYSKKPEDISDRFVNAVFGCKSPTPAKKQNEIFLEAVSAIETMTFDNAKNICASVCEKEQEAKEDEDKMLISERETVNMLEASGISGEALSGFKQSLKSAKEEGGEILTNNIIPNSNKLKVKTGITEISLPVEYADSIEVKKIDGRNCLVIEINDDLTVNGIKVNNFRQDI